MADDFEGELHARLSVIEDPTYVDPARADLPVRDVLLLVLGTLVVVVAMVVWSHPA